MVIELWAVEAFVLHLLLLLVLCKQLLCAFLSLIFLCGMMPFFVAGVLPMLEMQVSLFLRESFYHFCVSFNLLLIVFEIYALIKTPCFNISAIGKQFNRELKGNEFNYTVVVVASAAVSLTILDTCTFHMSMPIR
jgi:hypothetical protein